MLTIDRCPTLDVPSQLVFLAHDDAAEAVFRAWAERLDAPARTVVTRTGGLGAGAAAAIRRLPVVTPTVHVCAAAGTAQALELARDPRIAPDLMVVVDTGAGTVPAGPPVSVPMTVLIVHHADGSCVARPAPWRELTSRSVSFRVLPAGHCGLLDAGSVVTGVLARLVRGMVNDSPIEVGF
jgi:surfactin synthase thioesterase subunit